MPLQSITDLKLRIRRGEMTDALLEAEVARLQLPADQQEELRGLLEGCQQRAAASPADFSKTLTETPGPEGGELYHNGEEELPGEEVEDEYDEVSNYGVAEDLEPIADAIQRMGFFCQAEVPEFEAGITFLNSAQYDDYNEELNELISIGTSGPDELVAECQSADIPSEMVTIEVPNNAQGQQAVIQWFQKIVQTLGLTPPRAGATPDQPPPEVDRTIKDLGADAGAAGEGIRDLPYSGFIAFENGPLAGIWEIAGYEHSNDPGTYVSITVKQGVGPGSGNKVITARDLQDGPWRGALNRRNGAVIRALLTARGNEIIITAR